MRKASRENQLLLEGLLREWPSHESVAEMVLKLEVEFLLDLELESG